jgi:RNA polymerase sigma factor (sigma-70 family)
VSELLRRFTSTQDEAAFAELVRRHGRLVFGVARRILGNEHDAEDVFQATFLILARRAGSVRRTGALSAWIHGVAARVARKAGVSAARRRARERQAALPVLVAPTDDGPAELRQWVDAEIAALPDALRLPLVLCDLEGQTHEQAANRLGWRPSTLKARLHRAREALRRRLARCGLTGSALPALAQATGSAPDALAGATVRLAVLFARGPANECAGAGAAAGAALALAEGGTHLMFWTRTKALLAVLLVVALAGGGVGALLRTDPPAPAAAPAEPPGRRVDLHGDPLPPRALARLGTVRFRFPDRVARTPVLAFCGGGKELVAAAHVGVVVYDSSTGRPLRRLPTDELNIGSAAFSRDGRLVAVGGFQFVKENKPVGMIRVLETATGKEVRRFMRGADWSRIGSLAFTPDGKMLLSSSGGTVRVEEIATGAELLRQAFRAESSAQLCLSPDGSVLAVASGPNTRKVFVWEWQAGQQPREIKVPPNGAGSLAFLPDGKTLLTGDSGREGVRFWDVASGRLLRRVGERAAWRSQEVAVSPDGRYLVICVRADNNFVLYDAKTGKPVRRMAGLRTGAAAAVFSADSRRLAALGDGVLRVWDVATGKEVAPDQTAHRQAPTFVALLADGAAVTTGDDGVVRVWDAGTGRHCRTIDVTRNWVRAAAVSPDGRTLATSTLGKDNAVILWDLGTGRQLYRLAGHGSLGGLRALAFTPDGTRLASWGDDMYLRLWDVRNGKAVAEHEIRPDGRPLTEENIRDFQLVSEAAFAPGGSFLVVGSGRSLFVVDSRTGKQTKKIASEVEYTQGLAVSPDGNYLLCSGPGPSRVIPLAGGGGRSVGGKGLVQLVELASGKTLRRVTPGQMHLGRVAFSPDCKTFAVGGKDRIEFRATATGALRGTITGLPSPARSLAFAPDGKRVIAGLSDTTALVYDVPTK